MDYGKALKIGLARAENAIETIRRWAGMKACAMCTVKPALGVTPRSTRGWGPICEQSWKEIARNDGTSVIALIGRKSGSNGGGKLFGNVPTEVLTVKSSGTVSIQCVLKSLADFFKALLGWPIFLRGCRLGF